MLLVRGDARAERGAGSVLAIGLAAATLIVALLCFAVVGATVTRSRAATAADLAALAGAEAMLGDAVGVPCARAAEIAARNGAQLIDCRGDGPGIVVTVAIRSIGERATAVARAGASSPTAEAELGAGAGGRTVYGVR